MQKIIYTNVGIREVAKKIVESVPSKTLCFYGEMSSGKTTLIKALVEELGGADIASSPTFGLVNEYHTPEGELLAYHFDFYRIEDETEALDLGLEEYLSEDVWVFIEWPEKVTSFLPADSTELHLEIINGNTRKLSL